MQLLECEIEGLILIKPNQIKEAFCEVFRKNELEKLTSKNHILSIKSVKISIRYN